MLTVQPWRSVVGILPQPTSLGVPERPVHHTGVDRAGEPPLTLANVRPDLLCQQGAVEISNRSRLESRIHGEGAPHAAVRPLRVPLMEVRAPDLTAATSVCMRYDQNKKGRWPLDHHPNPQSVNPQSAISQSAIANRQSAIARSLYVIARKRLFRLHEVFHLPIELQLLG